MSRALLVLAVAACGNDTYTIVTIDRRASVHDATGMPPAKLQVTLSNGGTQRSDTFDVGPHDFPVTFSVSAPGITGDLQVDVDALGDDGKTLLGRGSTTTPLTAATASVLLEGAEFLVNTDVAGNQFLSDDYEAVGLQLAATTSGNWTAAFRDDCGSGTTCTIFGRRFDKAGIPLMSTVAASAMAFPVSTTQTQSSAIPAVAAFGETTLVFWDYTDTVGTGTGIACRALDGMGQAIPGQLSITTETADVVTAAPLSNGNYAVTWQAVITNQVIRREIIKPDCTPLTVGDIATVSTSAGATGARRSHVATNGPAVLYAWIVGFGGDVFIRTGTNTGALNGAADTKLVAQTAAMVVDHVRVAPLGAGFGVVVRWAALNSMSPGKIELYRVSAAGAPMGNPTLITDQSGSDFSSDKSFGVATRSDGAMMIVWHQCNSGAGSCDVYGRVVRPTGVPVGDPFVLSFETRNDQVNPSVVAVPDAFVAAWNDSSGVAPDIAGSAVRARVIYPKYDDASAVIGAPCGAGKPDCGMGLVCATGTDGQRCFAQCTGGACPAGGTCDTGAMACNF